MRDSPIVRRRPTRRAIPVSLPTPGDDQAQPSATAPLGNQAFAALASTDPAAAERVAPSALPHGNQALAASIAAGGRPPMPGNAARAADAALTDGARRPAAPPAGPATAEPAPGRPPEGEAAQRPPVEPELVTESPPAEARADVTQGDPWAGEAPGAQAADEALQQAPAGPTAEAAPTPPADAPAAPPPAPAAPPPGGEVAQGPAPEGAPVAGGFAFADGGHEGTAGERAARDQRRGEGAALVAAFLQQADAGLGKVDAAGAAQVGRVDAAVGEVRAGMSAAADAEKAALNAAIDAGIARAEATAAAALARVAAAFDAAAASVDAAEVAARDQVNADADAAVAQAEAARDAMLATLETLYGQMEADVRAAGVTVAGEARQAAAVAPQPVGDGHDDDLRGRRNAKWREATSKVGDEYAKALQDAANDVAGTVRDGIETDREGVRGTAQQAIDAIEAQRAAAVNDVQTKANAERDALSARRGAAEADVTAQQAAAIQALEAARGAGTGALDEALHGQLAVLAERSGQARTALQGAAAQIRSALADGVAAVRDALAAQVDVDPSALAKALGEATAQLSGAAQTGVGELGKLGDTMIADLRAAGTTTADVLGQIGQGAATDATTALDAALSGLDAAADAAAAQASQTAGAAVSAIQGVATAAATSFSGLVASVSDAYTQLEANITEGARANVEALLTQLRGPVTSGEIRSKAAEQGREAARSVQPWWKSVIKWVCIIAVAIVIAVVLGPLIIGALAPMIAAGAAALGASAAVASVVGTVVAGAVVGAVGGYVTNGVTNLFDGKGFNEGWQQAVLTGAVGGAIGAGASALVTRFAGPLAETFAVKWATDIVADTLSNVVTGNFTLEGLAQSILMGGLMNGVQKIRPVGNLQTRFSALGEAGANNVRPGSVDGFHAGMTDATGQVSKPAQARLDEANAVAPTRPAPRQGDGPAIDGPAGGARLDAGPAADLTPAQDVTPAQEVTPAQDVTPARAGDAEAPTTRPKTGRQQAAELGYPAPPEGYTWVSGGDGPPYLRRLPGGRNKGLPQLRYDAASGGFIDVTPPGSARPTAPAKRDSGTTVLGHYPEYMNMADAAGHRRFDIPMDAWNKMSPADRWAANTRFLERTIARGDAVVLATPLSKVKPGSYFEQELKFFQSRGYTPSADGTRLLPPGIRSRP